MFAYFLANGYTCFDTAYFYHDYKGEIAVRECLVKRYPRNSDCLRCGACENVCPQHLTIRDYLGLR